MSDLLNANFDTVQSDKQPMPTIAAAAATIAPTTKLSFWSGTTQVATIVPPVTGYCELTLCFTDANPGAFVTTGNIKTAYTPIQNRPIDLCFDPPSNKWWVKAVV
jgi:hypothetical protein